MAFKSRSSTHELRPTVFRIRKVKCDEARPACQRCVSTGRFCDGYGVWGGGSQALVRSKPNTAVPVPLAFGLASELGSEERQYFDWFRNQTTVKLAASYLSVFWKSLLFQAGTNEPAVLHACLALSSAQKRETVFFGARPEDDSGLDQQERFSIRHYVKAIGYLSPKLSVRDKTSRRVTLITCAVFISFELLRGHFETAQAHYENGLKAMEELQMLERRDDGIYYSRAGSELVEDHIFETFARYHFQNELFKLFGPGPNLPLKVFDDRPHQFLSINPAWRDLQQIMNDIFRLTNRGRRQERQQESTGYIDFEEETSMLEEQARLRSDLEAWLSIYDELTTTGAINLNPDSMSDSISSPDSSSFSHSPGNSSSKSPSISTTPPTPSSTSNRPIAPSTTKTGPTCESSTDLGTGHRLIRCYHTLARLTLEAALTPTNPMIYDQHTSLFTLLMSQMVSMWSMAVPYKEAIRYRGLPRNRVRIAGGSTTDVGCIPLLFYVAIKCRVHKIRMHAIRFLDICGHREGPWDAKTVAVVARRVVEVEEGGLRGEEGEIRGYGGDMLQVVGEKECRGESMLPRESRVDEVGVRMMGSPVERIGLRGTRRRGGLGAVSVWEEYDIRAEKWEACVDGWGG